MSTKTCSQTRAIQARRIFPFDVNMHNTLFGGNLTRIIDDCASITVSRHCRRLGGNSIGGRDELFKTTSIGSFCMRRDVYLRDREEEYGSFL